MRHLRNPLARVAVKLAVLVLRAAATLLDRTRSVNKVRIREANPNCPGCAGCQVSGVFWPTEINGDRSHDWIERCDECRRFDNDIQAAAELIRLGLTEELGIARPAGSFIETPFAAPLGQDKKTHH